MRWLGVDVGGCRKGFDGALVDDRRVVDLRRRLDVDGVVALVDDHAPAVVAIDSPRDCAPAGQKTRPGERCLNRHVCGIRWTPDEDEVRRNPYYAWIVHGLDLYEALADRPVELIEVFPTASWTRWCGDRAGRSRARWTRGGLAHVGLSEVPARTNQDQRDAIAAAVTARQHSRGQTEPFGPIIVPREGTRP